MYVYHVIPAANLAEKLSQICGKNLQKTFFGNSGAEAIEAALKIGKKFTKRHEIIALMCSFHGRTIGTLSVTGQAGRRRYDMGPYLGGVSYAPAPYCYRCSLGQEYPGCNLQCAKMIEDVIDYSTSRDVAAFIAEPLLGEGGIITPPAEYFVEVKRVLDRYKIPFVDDEVQTGFGRTGRMFGIEHYGVYPDVICMAKAIAGGLPLGACTARAPIGDAFEPGDHLSTFGGNPVSCASSLATIQVIEEERLVKRAEEAGDRAMKRLKELQNEYPMIGEVRGKGLMIGVELVKDPRSKAPAKEEAERLREMLRIRGVLIGIGGPKGNVLRLQPPLVVSDGQMEQALQSVEDSLEVVRPK